MDAPTARWSDQRRTRALSGRKAPVWTMIAGAAVIGILVGLLTAALSTPQAVAQLRPASTSDADFPFDWYPIDQTSLVQYDDYGKVRVWTAENEHGVPCLFVAVGYEWLSTGCAPGELDPIVDLYSFAGMRDVDSLDLPPGSVVRFVRRGDIVRVWVAERAEPSTPTP